MANPKGEIIERPIKASFMEGLTVLEYFISTHGARKGLADTALRTADSGYLTRRLVDVAQDVIVRLDDCKTRGHIEMDLYQDEAGQRQPDRPRAAATKLATKRGRELLKKNEVIDRDSLKEIVEAYADEKDAWSPCARCSSARPRPACAARATASRLRRASSCNLGDAVGIVAAQSIGEPGTQLTMRTFHTGGVAGADITHGLPRVVELFEARKPKGVAEMARESGKVAIEDEREVAQGDHPRRQGRGARLTRFPRRTLAAGAPGRQDRGGCAAQRGLAVPGRAARGPRPGRDRAYLVDEVQRVYKSQGVDINDKHIELIARQMLKLRAGRPQGGHGLPAGLAGGPAPSSSAATSEIKKAGWRDRPSASR